MIVYKATRPDGTDFFTGKFKYGKKVKHPTSKKMVPGDASTYLSFSKAPTDCTGFFWPCRLFKYETVGETLTDIPDLPNKVACLVAKQVEELPAWQAFGPQGEEVVALIEKAKTITPEQARRLLAARDAARYAAWDAARYAAWDAAWDAARYAAWYAAWYAARDAAWYAAWYAARAAARYAAWYAARAAARYAAWGAATALVAKDLISKEHFDLLYGPWASVMEVGR